MHKTSLARMLLVPCLLLALAGCGGPAPAAVQPSVRIVAPINGLKEVGIGRVTVTVRLAISNFTLVLSATGDKVGTGQVWLYENSKSLIKMATTSLPIVLPQPGTYHLKAVLVTNGKVVASSAPIVVSVTSTIDAFTKACGTPPPGGTHGPKRGTITLFCKGFPANSTINNQSTGTNGDIWFFVSGGGPGPEIGRISPSGLTLFTKGVPNLNIAQCGNPGGFAPGPDGNMWVTGDAKGGNTASIGRITPSGVITMFSQGLPTGPTGAVVHGLHAGPQGDMWFLFGPPISGLSYPVYGATSIGRITPSGVITMFTKGLPANSTNSQISGLVTGPDGNLRFTDQTFTVSSTGSQVFGPTLIGRITPSGVITMFSKGLPAGTQIGSGLVVGSDGNLWFSDGNSIGQITPSGLTMFAKGLPANSYIFGLVPGPDGNLWFTDQSYTVSSTGSQVPGPTSIGRITPSGVITLFSKGLPANSQISGLVPGSDGNLWFMDQPAIVSSAEPNLGSYSIGRITPSGAITMFSKGLPAGSQISGLMAGPDGNLWFQVFSMSMTGVFMAAMGRLIP